jgi:hypothetical protein
MSAGRGRCAAVVVVFVAEDSEGRIVAAPLALVLLLAIFAFRNREREGQEREMRRGVWVPAFPAPANEEEYDRRLPSSDREGGGGGRRAHGVVKLRPTSRS